MKKYFITGGDGFIGFFITKELLKDPENQVIIYDGHKNYVPLEKSNWFNNQIYRINELKKSSDRVVKIKGDVRDRSILQKALEDHKPNVIIHLASLPMTNVCNLYPEEARANVFELVTSLLEAIRSTGIKLERLVYTSSSMVYGNFASDSDGKIIPANENQNCNPIEIYGAMKLSGEHLIKVYSKMFGIPYTIIRPSAVYGPTDSNRRVTEVFLQNALNGKDLVLDNGGNHQLDFSYVEDIAKGFVLAANSPKAVGETFNITRGEGKTIKELAQIIKQLIPGTNIVERDNNTYRPNRGALDISKARNLLGFNPENSLEEGMKKYFEFVEQNSNTIRNGN